MMLYAITISMICECQDLNYQTNLIFLLYFSTNYLVVNYLNIEIADVEKFDILVPSHARKSCNWPIESLVP